MWIDSCSFLLEIYMSIPYIDTQPTWILRGTPAVIHTVNDLLYIRRISTPTPYWCNVFRVVAQCYTSCVVVLRCWDHYYYFYFRGWLKLHIVSVAASQFFKGDKIGGIQNWRQHAHNLIALYYRCKHCKNMYEYEKKCIQLYGMFQQHDLTCLQKSRVHKKWVFTPYEVVLTGSRNKPQKKEFNFYSDHLCRWLLFILDSYGEWVIESDRNNRYHHCYYLWMNPNDLNPHKMVVVVHTVMSA